VLYPSASKIRHITYADKPDMLETVPSSFPEGQGTIFKDPAWSYHGSSHANDSINNSPRSQPDELLEIFAKNQREQRAAQSQSAPIATSNQRPGSSRDSRPVNAVSTSSIGTAREIIGSERLRVGGALGKFWLNLDAPAQWFFESIQPQLEKKKKSFDRNTVSIFFHSDKQMFDDEVCELPLGEDELEADWEDTVDWIRENKREKAPHVYVTVQFNEG
jgi:hypothetical protein